MDFLYCGSFLRDVFCPQQRKPMGSGLQPRIAPVCTGAGAGPGSTGFRRRFRRRFQETLVQRQVRFNRVPEKVAEAKPGQVHLVHGNPAEVFPALGFAARFRKICKIKCCGCWGYTEAYFF